jgi:hypothetical protein
VNIVEFPIKRLFSVGYQGVAADDADGWLSICKAPFDGNITAAYFMPAAAITGHATDRRDIELFRATPAGSFGSVAANIDFTAGNGAFAHTEKAFTLSATAANLAVSEGDYVLFKSDTNGAGAPDVVGLVTVEITRVLDAD